MIDTIMGLSEEEDGMTIEGDASDLLEDTLNIIGNVYRSLLENCPVCPHLYKEGLLNSTMLEETFEIVEERFMEEVDEFEEEEDDEDTDYNPHMRMPSHLEMSYQDYNTPKKSNGLSGFEELKQKERRKKK